jgi:hypothetical protein
MSSGTSPGSSRAQITSVRPASRSAAIAAASSSTRALADHRFAHALAMRHDGAAGLVQRQRAKFHERVPAADGFRPVWPANGAPRRTATISAMIEARDFRRRHRLDVQPDRAADARQPRRCGPVRAAASAAPRGCFASRARRCRTPADFSARSSAGSSSFGSCVSVTTAVRLSGRAHPSPRPARHRWRS